MEEQKTHIQNLFIRMSSENGISAENIENKNAVCNYRWQLTTDKQNSVWELIQSPSHVVLRTVTLKFENSATDKVLFFLNRMNFYNRMGTLYLGAKGEIYLENAYFYRTNFYSEEEIALFISEMIDHLSFIYLVGENYLNNNLDIDEALRDALRLLREKKN